jgi:hypothetical protein
VRVHINAGGRQIEIECGDTNVTPGDIVTLAKAAWDHTAGAEPTAPAYGFSTDRRWVGDKTPDTMGAGWRRRGLGEVDA